jgi:hypothetical protein
MNNLYIIKIEKTPAGWSGVFSALGEEIHVGLLDTLWHLE